MPRWDPVGAHGPAFGCFRLLPAPSARPPAACPEGLPPPPFPHFEKEKMTVVFHDLCTDEMCYGHTNGQGT